MPGGLIAASVGGLFALGLVLFVLVAATREPAPAAPVRRFEPGERRQEFYLGRARDGYLADVLTVDELERSVAHALAGGDLDPDGRVEAGPAVADAYAAQRALVDEMRAVRGVRDAGRPLVLAASRPKGETGAP